MAEPKTSTNLEKAREVGANLRTVGEVIELTIALMETPISELDRATGVTISDLVDEYAEALDVLIPGAYERIGTSLLMASVPRAGKLLASCLNDMTAVVMADLSG